MKVLVTGSSGLVGSALVPFLAADGHSVTRMIRGTGCSAAGQALWEPAAGRIDATAIEGFDAAVHLSGANVSGARWTPKQKQKLLDSRINSTRLLATALANLARPPRVLVAASAVGYYGDRGDEPLTEDSTPGSGFPTEMCLEWEKAAEVAAGRGIRVVNLRIGMVLASAGAALRQMLPPFKLGLGGPLGSGRQYVSWIELDDLAGVIRHTLLAEPLRGPVNAVAPNPVTNREFTKALGGVLGRPTPFRVPRFVLRLAFGEITDALLLASARVYPTRLEASGYAFRYPELQDALRHALGRTPRAS
ncbi:MAG TPA: TIGR01777 family oxidoreductase [Terriglobia bacterium]|nr:TIGR01777 family oxidoreductase [Terriglobia bacterium]